MFGVDCRSLAMEMFLKSVLCLLTAHISLAIGTVLVQAALVILECTCTIYWQPMELAFASQGMSVKCYNVLCEGM